MANSMYVGVAKKVLWYMHGIVGWKMYIYVIIRINSLAAQYSGLQR